MATITQDVIQLDFREGDRQVTVSPQDQDRFTITVEQAAWSCQMGHQAIQYQKLLLEMFGHIHQWCQQRADKVERCLAGFQDGQWTFFFTNKTQKYDFSFGDALADLDIELAEKFNGIQCDTLQIPAQSPGRIRTFIEPSKAILIYGNHR